MKPAGVLMNFKKNYCYEFNEVPGLIGNWEYFEAVK